MSESKRTLFWFCTVCRKSTVHKVTAKMPSEWTTHSLGIGGYERWRQCECERADLVTTLEVETDALFKLEMELKQLRKVKIEHDQLLAALRDRNAAEQRISAIVHPTTETPSNQAINVTPVTLAISSGSQEVL